MTDEGALIDCALKKKDDSSTPEQDAPLNSVAARFGLHRACAEFNRRIL